MNQQLNGFERGCYPSLGGEWMPYVAISIILALLMVIAYLTLSGTVLGIVMGILGTLLVIFLFIPLGLILYAAWIFKRG